MTTAVRRWRRPSGGGEKRAPSLRVLAAAATAVTVAACCRITSFARRRTPRGAKYRICKAIRRRAISRCRRRRANKRRADQAPAGHRRHCRRYRRITTRVANNDERVRARACGVRAGGKEWLVITVCARAHVAQKNAKRARADARGRRARACVQTMLRLACLRSSARVG